MKENNKLENLKKEYKILKEKYKLPEFKFLNENFEIESIDVESTDLLIKRIRKQITEKLSSGLRALELFLNPQNSPMFIFNLIKSFSQTDKDIVNELHKKFSDFEIEAFGLENNYDEKKEAEFIKMVCLDWPEISKDFDRIYKSMKIGNKQESKKNEKSYFG